MSENDGRSKKKPHPTYVKLKGDERPARLTPRGIAYGMLFTAGLLFENEDA